MSNVSLQLLNCTPEILRHVIAGDEHLGRELQLKVPENWSTFGIPAFRYALEIVSHRPEHAIWYTYLPILTKSRTLIGSCGYKGPPDELGMVEIGYEVASSFRNLGYATEIARLLVRQAFQDSGVKMIQAHTLAEENASVRVLRKNGFQFAEETEDEEDGMIWRWVRLP